MIGFFSDIYYRILFGMHFHGLNFGRGLHLYPYFVYTSSDGSGDIAHKLLSDAIQTEILCICQILLYLKGTLWVSLVWRCLRSATGAGQEFLERGFI